MTHENGDTPKLGSDDLDALFDEVGKVDAQPSAEFLARIAADMEANLPPPPAEHAPAPARHRPWWQEVLEQLGGVPAAAGLAVAGVVGLAIGGVDPANLDTAARYLGLEVVAYDVDDLFVTFPILSEDG